MMIQRGMEGWVMPSAVRLREDYSAAALRRLAKRSKDAKQSRRLLSLGDPRRNGLARSGQNRRHGSPDVCGNWVHRFSAQGPDGLIDNWTGGPKPRLSAGQLTEFAEMVETGPDPRIDGVARWRRIDLKRVIGSRFGVKFHECYVGKLLKKLGFSHMSAHPRHCGQAEGAIEDFKKPVAGCGPPVAVETGLIS
jgi:putative transposase